MNLYTDAELAHFAAEKLKAHVEYLAHWYAFGWRSYLASWPRSMLPAWTRPEVHGAMCAGWDAAQVAVRQGEDRALEWAAAELAPDKAPKPG